MEQSMHEFVIERLQATKGTWRAISVATGVSKRTIEKIANRDIKDPGVTSIETLARHFSEAGQDA